MIGLAALLAAGGLLAQNPSGFADAFELESSAGVRTLETRVVRVDISGGVAVDYRGDESTGCAATGLCGVQGTVSWTPAGRGAAIAIEYTLGGRRRMVGLLGLEGDSVTAADVRRHTPDGGIRRCIDTHHTGAGVSLAGTRAGGLELAFPGSVQQPTVDALRTRCAGPLQADLRAALPSRAIDRTTMRRGRTVVDLRGDRPFAAGGLAGTVRSTLVLRLGPSRRDDDDQGRRRRKRALTVTYAIERVEGGMTATLAGSPDPALCEPLDACGTSGSITATPGRIGRGEVTLTATAPARRPWRDLRAALGLARRGRHSDIAVSGAGVWTGGTGATTATLRRSDGTAACVDSVPLAEGLLVFEPDDAGLGAGLTAGPNAPLTRCPGLGGADLAPDEFLATAQLTLRALRNPRPTLRLTRQIAIASDGYTGRIAADVRVALRRTAIRRATILDDG